MIDNYEPTEDLREYRKRWLEAAKRIVKAKQEADKKKPPKKKTNYSKYKKY